MSADQLRQFQRQFQRGGGPKLPVGAVLGTVALIGGGFLLNASLYNGSQYIA